MLLLTSRPAPPIAARVGSARFVPLLLALQTLLVRALIAQPLPAQPLLDQPPQAQASTLSSSPVKITVVPTLGEQAPACAGWTSYQIEIENRVASDLAGTLFLTPNRGLFREADVEHAFVETPVYLSAEGRLSVEMLAYGPTAGAVDAVFVDQSKRELGRGQGESSAPEAPHLFDLSESSGTTLSLRGKTLPLAPATPPPPGLPPTRPAHADTPIALSIAAWDREGNRPTLPSSAAGYCPVTLVHGPSDRLLRAGEAEQAALADWVLSGGQLALSVSTPSDLSHPLLVRLLGGVIHTKPAPSALLDDQQAYLPPPLPSKQDARRGEPPAKLTTVEIPNRLTLALRGFSGGNLHDSPWGAVASYGLGQVHLLGFAANAQPFVGETWSELKVLGLLEHAAHSRHAIALPHAGQSPQADAYSVLEFLRYNRNQHWAILAAALLLIAYAVIVGPVNFRSAERGQRPLLPLLRLAIGSLVALVSVLALGVAARGTSERSSHLSFVEAGAGMSRASATRFRSFHAASFEGLVVRATGAGSLLGIVNHRDGIEGRLLLGAAGPSLDQLRAKPWQTVFVREEGFADLSRGVHLVRSSAGVLEIENQLGRDLAGVLVKNEAGDLVFFRSIADGQRVNFTAGTPSGAGRRRSGIGGGYLFDPDAEEWIDDVVPGAVQGWRAIENLSTDRVDWWPKDVPVLIGQVVGGEGRLRDSGFRLQSDRVLLRVVGYGGGG